MRTSSRVVSAASMSGTSSWELMGSVTSRFFAVQGMSATEKMSFGARSWASANQVFATAPNIIMGLFAVDRCGTASVCASLARCTQAGQQLVNMGQVMPFSSGVRSPRPAKSSVPSSMMVRSAARQVSKT